MWAHINSHFLQKKQHFFVENVGPHKKKFIVLIAEIVYDKFDVAGL